MNRILRSLLAPLLLLPTGLSAGPEHALPRLADAAGEFPTCIAIYDVDADQYLVHNMAQCQERMAPCSTFKIPNALIGLETGVLGGPGDTRAWDGTVHQRTVLNQDHDLASAIRDSVVWYFQDVALEIGPEQMQHYLDIFDYGNRDLSGGQDRFWLVSSLRINALEQVRFMAALDAGTLPAHAANQATVKALMRQQANLPDGLEGTVYGKTGSCPAEPVDHGWFAGFYHRDGRRWAFAVNVKGNKQWGWQARTIALEALGLIP